MQFFANRSGNESDQKGCYDGSLADTVQLTRQEERSGSGNDGHRNIECDFRHTELRLPSGNNRADKGFARQHDNISEHFHVNTDAEDQTSDQKISNFCRIHLRIQCV